MSRGDEASVEASPRMSRVVKLVMGLHDGSLKVVKFMMKLHHGSPKGGEASVKAS